MVEVLSAFPARPPTPPKASHSFIKRDSDCLPGRKNVLGTPGESPSSTAESTVLRSNKKVNFSPITSYIKPPTFANHATISKNEVRSLPPSNECRPAKSILKATSAVLSADDMTLTEENKPQPFVVLLESATQQLGGESLSSRVDAYMQLLGAFKTYENDTEHDAIVLKLGLLLQFIRRDISREIGKGDLVEMNLVTNALKLGIYFIWTQNFASQIPDEFKIFIVDHSLSALQNGKLPKSILNHYIHILYTQNFPPKIMTNSRMTQILAVLNDITDRVNGNNIISQRLGVYTRLLSQSKTVIASQAPLWVEHLISGLLHTMKDTRSKALTLGNQAALLLGPNMSISKSILDIFNKELPQGRKLISEVCDRMCRMMPNPESGIHVPQIWSIIVLLLRSKRFNIEYWEYFKEWVLVLQKCFNCSDPGIKSQAIIGWNKFVYVVTCNESTSTSMLKMLTKPILSHCERKRGDRAVANMNPLFLSSYYNLLYYSVRPSTSFEHIDFIWEEYISQPFANIFANSPQLNDAACKALSSLLWTPQAKVWTDTKINEVARMEAEHLLPVDCRWIRSRIVSVIQALEVLLSSADWTNTMTVWTRVCKAIADASSKEIKPSTELMQAISTILGLFQRLRHGAPSSLNAETDEVFLERFTFFSTTFITTIGPSPFTETFLLKTSQATFQAANTPTHRRSRTDDNLDTPFMHVLRMIGSFEMLSEPTKSSLGCIDALLEAASKSRQSRGSRLDFLERCTQATQIENEETEKTATLVSYVWEAAARLSLNCLSSLPMEMPRDRDGSLSRDYVNVTSILLRGLHFTTTFATWSSLLDAYVRIVRTEKGERGISSLVIEPLAKKLKLLNYSQVYLPTKALISQASSLTYYQHDKLPAAISGSSHESSVLFLEPLLDLISKVILESYDKFTNSNSSQLAEVVESLSSLFGSGTLQFRFLLLERLQDPLAVWLRDSNRCLTAENGADNRLLTACRTLSLAIANALQIAVPHNTASLHTFEAIISAGLESVHKSTVNRFVEMWNATFGLQETVTYPSDVQIALQKLESLVELQLPCPLPRQMESQELKMPSFVESQDTTSDLISNTGKIKNSSNRMSRLTTFSSSPIIQSTEGNQDPTLPKQKTDSLPRQRLRHDNSKMQSAAIDSSLGSYKLDDQLLTDRQRGNTSTFLEGIQSSSPVVPDVTTDTGVLSPVQLPKVQDPVLHLGAPSTPILAANLQDNDDDFPGSSPTPGAKDQASLHLQTASGLSIETFSNLDSDPPSSPPDISSHSPRNEQMTHRGSLEESGSETPSNNGLSAKKNKNKRKNKNRNRRHSSRISPNKAPEESADVTKRSEIETETTQQQPNVPEKGETESHNESMEVILDTYADEFEQQLASQLEKDLELAVDIKSNDDIQSTQSSDVSLPSGPVTRKRKRNAATEEASTPEPVKRRLLRNSKTASQESVSKKSSQSENSTPPTTPQASIVRRGISTPQSSPLKNEVSRDELSDISSNSGSRRRRRRRRNAAADRQVASSPIQPGSSGTRTQTRQSLRLSGGAAVSPLKFDVKSRGSKHRKKNSQSSNSNNNESVPLDRVHEDDQMQDVEMLHGDNVVVHNESTDNQVALAAEAMDVTNEQGSFSDKEKTTQAGDDVTNENLPENAVDLPISSDNLPRYTSEAVQTEDTTDVRDTDTQSGPIGGILGSLRQVLTDIRQTTFSRAILREIDDVMFDIRVEAHEAARRSEV